MAEKVDPQVVDDLTSSNVKTIAGAPASYSNMLLANMTAAQGRANDSANAIQHAMLQSLVEGQSQRAGLDISEAASVAPIAALSDTLAASIAQAIVKAVQTIPPATP